MLSKPLLLCVVLAAVLGTMPVAHAQTDDTTVIIRGGGWGHGLGLSQYGAYGRAQNGRSATEILEHYYTGDGSGPRAHVQTQTMPARVRVGLLQGRNAINATSAEPIEPGTGRVVFKVTGTSDEIASGNLGAEFRVEPSPTGGMRLFKNGTRVEVDGVSVFGDPNHPLRLVYQNFGSRVRIQEKATHYVYGYMEFDTYQQDSCTSGYCLRLIVALSMQKYLYGLGEVPSSWPRSALKAQAIAGRTYAYEKILRLGQRRFPCDCAVYDSTIDQAYIGDSKRTGYDGVQTPADHWEDWVAAVDATNSKVILYAGEPIQAFYSSSSGGHTEHNENVWGGTPIPYLRGVPDGPDDVDANPNHTWKVEMTWSEFENKLRDEFRMGELQDFKLVRPFGISGRVTVVKTTTEGGVKIVGANETVRADGWDVRNALGLKDTLFRVEIKYAVGGKFQTKYMRLNGAPGEPVSPVYTVPIGWDDPLGRAQDFTHGRMNWRKSTDKTVWQRGLILEHYDSLGREKSALRLPTSDIWGSVGKYRGATYATGSIVWSEETGARVIRGPFRDAYRRLGGVEGVLGLPVTNRQKADTLPGGGRRQLFERGTMYLNPQLHEAFALWSQVLVRYRALGEASGKCGYPVSDLIVDGYGKRARFENGIISWTSFGGIEVDCS